MKNALSVNHLNKSFKDFSLQNISFTVPQGSIVGLVGENGSGKSTCIKCILGQDTVDSGSISIFDKNALKDIDSHRLIAVATDKCGLPEVLNPREISKVLNSIFENWDEQEYFNLLNRFKVPLDKKIKKMSRGTKVKTALCAALSHQAKLLFLDEATSGLDPIVREEILDLLLEFMSEEENAVFMTSHITSDLERIADYILFIQDGKILFMLEKRVLENYGIARLKQDEMEFIDPSLILYKRKQALNTDVLVGDYKEFQMRYPDYALDKASLDDVILMYSRGEQS